MLENYNDIQEEENNLRDYLKIFLRRKWIIVSFVVVMVAIITIYSLKTVPIYRTTVTLMIDKQNPNVVSFEEVLRLSTQGTAYYQSQLEILESRSLARRVIKTLNLKDSPEYKHDGRTKNFSIRGLLGSLIGKLHSKAKSPENESQKSGKDRGDSGLVSRYLSRLKTKPIKGSYVVKISFEGVHPEIITKIANGHAREYIEQNLETRFAASQDAVTWLKKQILEEKKKVEKAENALQLYKEEKQIVSLEERQNIIVQKLKDLNSALTNARTERISIETVYNQTIKLADKPDLIKTIPKIANNALIEGLKMEYINLQSEIAKVSDKFGEKYPAMIKLSSHAKELEKTINSEVNKTIKGIETEYNVALSREENLSRALDEQKKVALDLNRKAIAYGALEREAESERAMYDILMKRLKETDITGELKTSNIRIIDLAEVPKSPIRPRTRKNIIFAALIGLSLGVGMAFLLERLDNTIKSSEDVERFLGVPVLGVLEKVRVTRDKKQPFSEIIAHDIPKSTFAEAIRNVRTSIIFSSTDSPRKLLLVTSALQGEGKTFIASNLAITIAQAGKNTLLVDTDFRKPKVDRVFNMKRDLGLSNYLIGESDYGSIIRSTHVPNLSIATCGLIPPNPSEILGSHSMETFCKSVREKFDTVLFDTPPSMTVTDAFVLSRIVDGVIFVIKSGQTVKEAARKAISQMTNNEHEVMGVVMNYIDVSKVGYYHYYSHYYENESDIEKSSNETDKV